MEEHNMPSNTGQYNTKTLLNIQQLFFWPIFRCFSNSGKEILLNYGDPNIFRQVL